MPHIIQSNIFGHFHLIAPQYWGGLSVIAPVLLGYFFYGLYINFMIGPVLTKRTRVLVWITLLGAAVSITTNLLLVPHIGIVGAGWAVACSYFSMAVALFIFTHKNYPLPYQYGKLFLLALLGVAITLINRFTGGILSTKIILLCLYPIAAGLIVKNYKGALK